MSLIQNYNALQPSKTPAANVNSAASSISANQYETEKEMHIERLPHVTPDYNVKTPMAYRYIEDIKLNDNITAKVYKLANGQNVVIAQKDGPTIIKTYVNTGSFNEPDNVRGISHYIEHNLFNGSEDLGDKVFFDEVNKMGADTNASTSFSVTDYFISSNLLEDTDLENSIKLHAGMLQSPKFLLDKLEKEKDIVNSEINMYMAEDESLGSSQTVKNLYNIKSSSIDLVAGSTDNITALTRDDVVKYFNDNYYPANMTTVITGEAEPDDTMRLVSKYFTSNKTPQDPRHFEEMKPIEKTIRQDIISQKSEGRACVFLGFAGPENRNSKDKLLLQALFKIAGGLSNSRFSDLERKYGSGVNISPERLGSRPQDRNIIMVETKIPDEKVESFLKELYAIIAGLSQNPPAQEELTAAKNQMKKEHNQMLEISGALNYQIGRAFLNNDIDTLTNFDDMVNAVTSQDIAAIAKKYLDLNKAALTVVHPNTVTEEEIKSNYAKLSSISFTGTNKKVPIDVNNVSKYRMGNNFEVILNDINTQNVSFKFILEEKDWTPKKAAVSEILSEMLSTSGTKDRTIEECLKTEDILGLDTGIRATQYGITQSANFPVENSQEVLTYLPDRVKNPDLSQKVFEESTARLRDYYSTCEVSAYDKYNASIYKGTPRVFTPKDKLASLDTITLDDIKAFYNDTFKNGMGHVVITAPFTKHPELKEEIFKSLNNYPAVQPADVSLPQVFIPIEKPEVYTEVNKKNQAKILQGYKFKNTGNIKDKICVELLNKILGDSTSSRLFSDLREKRHLAYAVYSNADYLDDIGVFTMGIGTTTENMETGEKTFDNIKKSIDGFNDNIKRITTQKVTTDELDNAKRNLKSMLLNSLETSTDKNSMITYADSTPYGVDYINKSFEIIDTITPDDIYNTAWNIFSSNPVYSITATKDSIDANKDFLNSLRAKDK